MKKVNYILQKPLPNCPAGRVFMPVNDGKSFFLSMTTLEHIDDKIQHYSFTTETVLNNPDWFKIEDESDIKSQIQSLLYEKACAISSLRELRKKLKDIKDKKNGN